MKTLEACSFDVEAAISKPCFFCNGFSIYVVMLTPLVPLALRLFFGENFETFIGVCDECYAQNLDIVWAESLIEYEMHVGAGMRLQ